VKNLFIALGVVILFILAGLYINVFSPTAVMRSNTEKALQQFADAVETQDRAKVGEALTKFLSEDATIHLEVTFSAINSANVRPMTQDFTKATFITFIDNILYTVSDYHYRPTLQEFLLGENNMAKVQFTSGQWADGPSFYSGVSLMMHFSGDAQCNGETVFENEQPKLKSANCSLLLRSVTKSDSTGNTVEKARQLHDMLQQHQP